MPEADLFPAIEPYASGRIRLDHRHVMYYEECGHRAGMPVVFLHGGPGAGCVPVHRRFFNPQRYRAVLYDQRGAGRSTPLGELEDNTTQHLIGDLEVLRRHLGIERWILFGGSWGSTLALAYAQAHPQNCAGLILRGIFLAERDEIDWFLYGVRRFFPDAWNGFAGFLPEAERDDLLAGYHRRLVDPDPALHMPAAHAWSTFEGLCSTLRPDPETVSALSADRVALSLARIEAHYFLNTGFLEPGALIAGIDRIRSVPTAIVQGRYDAICPPMTADRLARAWPEADYLLVPNAGHSALEPGIRRQLVATTERFLDRI
ncbi:MAG: prolyl aminopeptidase [Kiloniellales bacterium]